MSATGLLAVSAESLPEKCEVVLYDGTVLGPPRNRVLLQTSNMGCAAGAVARRVSWYLPEAVVKSIRNVVEQLDNLTVSKTSGRVMVTSIVNIFDQDPVFLEKLHVGLRSDNSLAITMCVGGYPRHQADIHTCSARMVGNMIELCGTILLEPLPSSSTTPS